MRCERKNPPKQQVERKENSLTKKTLKGENFSSEDLFSCFKINVYRACNVAAEQTVHNNLANNPTRLCDLFSQLDSETSAERKIIDWLVGCSHFGQQI